jgi:tetratricopeptide (TPR) repeat protein
MNDTPTTEEIRATVERMIVSDAFSRSPQLGAFLRFVVEAVLQGTSDRIKGYTIGVEVLRRDPSFDPQTDPIVRVEATRLRRTIERYYAGPGAEDPIIVDLPRGSYVPVFRRREQTGAAAAGFLPRLQHALRGRIWPALATAIVLLLGFAVFVLMQHAPSVIEHPTVTALPSGNGMPVVAVEAFEVTGSPSTLSPSALLEKIRDAFSRFDTINMVLDPKEGQHTDYRVLGSIDYRNDHSVSVRFRLLDTENGKIVWTQAFDNVTARGDRTAEDEIVISLATALLQSYSVIRSLDHAKHLASSGGDPRYRCILQAAEALRSQQPPQYERARSCLEQLTTLDPSFAVGFSFLAVLYTRDYYLGPAVRPDNSPELDRALRAARRAVELNPASSRAYVMMCVVLYARHDVPEAFAAAEKAMALNPYDMLTVAEYGGRLIMTGEIERGMAMLRRAGEYGAIRPSWHHFYMFLGAYLGGDMREAAYQASQITADGYPAGHFAKALTAAVAGDSERARAEVDRLFALRPAWRDDPAAQFGKFIYKPEFVERLVRDLAAARLGGRS